MKAILKNPGKKPEIIEVENELAALQEAVGGAIETYTFAADACVICNEEGFNMELLWPTAEHKKDRPLHGPASEDTPNSQERRFSAPSISRVQRKMQ